MKWIKDKRLSLAMLLSLFSIVANIGINFLLTPCITNSVGAEAYGFVSLAKQFVSYANMFMATLNAFAARFLTIAYIKNDDNSFKRYYSTVFIADIVIGGVLLIVGCICVSQLENILSISSELVADVKLLFLLSFLSFFLSTITTVFTASAYIKDHLDYVYAIKLFAYISETIILLFCFAVFDVSVWYVGVASVMMATVTLVASCFMTRKLLPKAHIGIGDFSAASLKKLIGSGMWTSINSLGNGLHTGLDLLVTNVMLNGTAMGQLSIVKTLNNVVFQLYGALAETFRPSFLKKYADRDETLIGALKTSMSICGSLINVIFAGFCAVGLEFLSLWIPTQDIRLIYELVIIALIPTVFESCIYPAYYTYTLTLKNKIPCIITIIGGIVNILVKILLLKYTSTGIYAVLITTAVIMTFISLVTNPLYICRCLGVKWTTLYPTIFKNLICCLITVACLQIASGWFTFNVSWIGFIVKACILAVIGTAVQIPFIFGKTIYMKLTRK